MMTMKTTIMKTMPMMALRDYAKAVQYNILIIQKLILTTTMIQNLKTLNPTKIFIPQEEKGEADDILEKRRVRLMRGH